MTIIVSLVSTFGKPIMMANTVGTLKKKTCNGTATDLNRLLFSVSQVEMGITSHTYQCLTYSELSTSAVLMHSLSPAIQRNVVGSLGSVEAKTHNPLLWVTKRQTSYRHNCAKLEVNSNSLE